MGRFFYISTLVFLAGFITFQISADSALSRTRPQPTPTPRPTPKPSPTPTSAPGPTTTELKLKIQGVVNRCTPGDIIGSEVYLEGESFFLKTGTSGDFKFYGVPVGSHQLVFDLPNLAPYKTSVSVGSQTTNMGAVNVCPDGDEDGFNAKDDCNDDNNTIYPGAPEVCNYIDDDCDEERDEGLIPNPQDVSIQIISPENGSATSNLDEFDIKLGNACTLDFLGAPNDYAVFAVLIPPNGFPIKATLAITKPSGIKLIILGEDYLNPNNNYGYICAQVADNECSTLVGSSGLGHIYFDEFGTYTITATAYGKDNSVLAQDSIDVINPEPEPE